MQTNVKNIPINDLKYLYEYLNKKDYPWLYLSKEGTLLKNCIDSPNAPSNLSERLTYVADMPLITGYTRPLSLLQDEEKGIYGYEQVFLKQYRQLDEMINSLTTKNRFTMQFAHKKKLCLDLLATLKKINQYYYVGDISLQNLMIGQKDVQIIDWENGTPKDQKFSILSLYNIEDLDNVAQLDVFKMFLACLSILYECDVQLVCSMLSLAEIDDIFRCSRLNKVVQNYLEDFTYEVNINSGRTPNFDEYLKHIKHVSINEKKRIRYKRFYR